MILRYLETVSPAHARATNLESEGSSPRRRLKIPPHNPRNFLDDIVAGGTFTSFPLICRKLIDDIEAGWSSLELVLVGVELNGLVSPWM